MPRRCFGVLFGVVLRVVGAGCVLGDDDELFSMDGPCGQHGNESTLFAVVKHAGDAHAPRGRRGGF